MHLKNLKHLIQLSLTLNCEKIRELLIKILLIWFNFKNREWIKERYNIRIQAVKWRFDSLKTSICLIPRRIHH